MFDSGITTLNLAVSGKLNEFVRPGNTISYVGESDAGKTVAALTTQAASFYKYGVRPVYYAAEPNLEIDIARLYGKKFSKALIIVDCLKMSLEEWQADARGRFKAAKKPICAALDSTDAIKCVKALNALNGKHKKADGVTATPNVENLRSKGMKAGMGGAAEAWSMCLSEVNKTVALNKGMLILLSQCRTNPSVQFGSPYYRSNGAALDFHSEVRVWFYNSTAEAVDKIKVGGWSRVEVKRNKVNGVTRTIYAPIYPQYGIDDTRAMLHFLAETDSGVSWSNQSGMNSITVGDKTMTLAEMAAYFEGPETKDVLKQMVVDAWAKREAMLLKAVLADRKPRFG